MSSDEKIVSTVQGDIVLKIKEVPAPDLILIPFTETESDEPWEPPQPPLPRHPGSMLRERMSERGLSAYKLARILGIQRARLERIAAEQNPVTVEVALLLARYFGGPAEHWLESRPARNA